MCVQKILDILLRDFALSFSLQFSLSLSLSLFLFLFLALSSLLSLHSLLSPLSPPPLCLCAPFSPFLVGEWFAFWSVGVRLLLAGLRQIIQPRYTAEVILSLKSEEPFILVRELGFANLSVGLLGVGSLFFAPWRSAAVLVGGVFYGLAGFNHLLQPHRGKLENVAMLSDLWAAID